MSYLDSSILGYDDALGALEDALVGADDDMGDDDMGRRVRRGQRRRLQRLARRSGQVMIPRQQAETLAEAARRAEAQAGLNQAAQGNPNTVGPMLAATGQRELLAPLSQQTLAIAAGSSVTLTTNIQRAIQIRRLVLTAADTVTGADASFSCGISSIKIGADDLFNATGVVPFQAFSANAWNTMLMAFPAGTGNTITIVVTRLVAVTNTSVINGVGFGPSAGTR